MEEVLSQVGMMMMLNKGMNDFVSGKVLRKQFNWRVRAEGRNGLNVA